uniref:Uncharacterized protein n=1 Tax=Physcomitrium patens TaxID=3218 RepID=A0A7I4D408_PHYPA|nr:uncharacterized protein LOC112277635 isoform X2 [Physcomitrium patens]|eukprot:XP_024365945.1 uncharacterized protein LOC112277635 isoform X2 [Physcomitrella patens]
MWGITQLAQQSHPCAFMGESGKSYVEMQRLCEVLLDAVPKMKGSSLFDEMARATSSEDKLTMENFTLHKGLNHRGGHVRADSVTLQMSEVVGEEVLTTQQRRSAPCERSVLSCMISFNSMERARSTLEDFCRSYFMFHGMDAQNPTHIFRYLPLLVFVESFIYQLDEENEDQLCLSEGTGGSNRSHDVSSEFAYGLGKDPFTGMRSILQQQDLLTERIDNELKDGLKYWCLEQSLCTALSTGKEVKPEDVLRALRLKSFDYRILNLLLYGLLHEPVNEAHFEFLSVSELLVEISDDLFDYEEDVVKNTFNVLRMFVHTYGSNDAPIKLAQFISKIEDEYQALLVALEPDIRDKYTQRCEEAVKEGGSKSVHVLGDWTIPPLITDENAFRIRVNEDA